MEKEEDREICIKLGTVPGGGCEGLAPVWTLIDG